MIVTVLVGVCHPLLMNNEADKSLRFIFCILYNWNQLLWKSYFDVLLIIPKQ